MSIINGSSNFPPVRPPFLSKAWFDLDNPQDDNKELEAVEDAFEKLMNDITDKNFSELEPTGSRPAGRGASGTSGRRGREDVSGAGGPGFGSAETAEEEEDGEPGEESEEQDEEMTDMSDQAESMVTDPELLQEHEPPSPVEW